jgi:hypothetical protein
VLGGFSELLGNGGVNGGKLDSVGKALVSPGLGFDAVVPASEGLCLRASGGSVADVGVGGMGCGCDGAFVAEVVALRLLFGRSLE